VTVPLFTLAGGPGSISVKVNGLELVKIEVEPGAETVTVVLVPYTRCVTV
jgi:hypothetical protein